MNKAAESNRHRIIGTILLSMAAVCILIGVLVMIFLPKNYMAVITFVIIAMVLGNYAFQHFEKSAAIKPESDIRHQMELLGTALKNQSPVSVYIEFHYPIDQDSPYVLERISAHFQSSLNRAILKIDRLPEDPYAFIDSILSAETVHLCNELNLRTLSAKTIAVNTALPSAAGIRLRTR